MKSIFSLVCLCLFFTVQSQKQGESKFPLEGPSDWRKEVLSLPLSFAPELAYEGTEYVLFAKGWSDQNATDFWTYTFAWVLDESPEFTADILNIDLKHYFDGLMTAVSGSEINSTKAQLKAVKNEGFFEGQVKVFDAFFLKDTKELNVRVQPVYCHKAKKHFVYFRFSPKAFDTPLWNTMKMIRIPCE
ncbi:hypothetical protein [Spongiimicrobium salis]|uniref:hypothetical protein n=1 Tax=Spongiimicrobium salis TaxID=1667022 RepID=UPI00374CAE41